MTSTHAAGRRRLTLLLGLLLALGVAPAGAQSEEPVPPPWRVLIIWGAQPDNPAAAAAVQALRSALTEGAAPRLVNTQSEVQDSLSFDAASYEAELLALLRKKRYAGSLDLLLVMGDSAMQFALRYQKELWPDVPIVYFGGPGPAFREGRVPPNTTGVGYDVDEPGTLRLARRLQPDAERVVLVAGDSPYDRGWWPRLEAAAAREAAGLEVETLFGLELPTLLDRVSRLPPRSIVLYTTISRDVNGQIVTPANVAELLSRTSSAPLYGVWESQVGRGIVGGSMESLAAHGRRVAGVALRVLRGTPPEQIPFAAPSADRAIVDWRQLQRFSLPASSLPPGAEIRYRPPSFLEEHRGLVVAGALVLAVQSGLIVALLAQARQRKRAESDAARQRADLAHAARLTSVGELTASIAHEINQPLGAILSNAEAAELFLDSDPPKLDRVRRILQDIREEDHRASAVIREVRALARKQPLQAQPLSVNGVVGDVLPLVEADARRRGVAVEADLDTGLPEVSGDRTQLQQVVLNLALNALDALGPTGSGRRRVKIRTQAEDGQVELSVSDTGPGLTEAEIHRLFESFFTTKAQGLGLGLSIVRSIVEGHGGRVTGENNAGPGATFRVRLPAQPREEPPPQAEG